MKYTLSILMILCSFSCLTQNNLVGRTDIEKDNLKGNIKAVKVLNDTLLLAFTEYNKDGFKQRAIFYNPNGQLRNEIKYIYNEGFLIEQISTFADSSKFRTQYKHNGLHQVIEEVTIFPDNQIDSRIQYEYDKENRVIKRTYIPKNGASYCNTYEYSANFKKEIHCTYGLEYYNELSDGLTVKRTEYMSNGDIHMGYIYEYNQNKDIILEIELWNNKETDRIQSSYIYDKKENWIQYSKEWKSGGKSILKREIEYY